MCLVEAGERKPDGTIVMQPKVVPACQTPARDGTVVITNSDRVRIAQKQTLEDILLNHPLDCPVCDKAGECLLQDYSYRFGKSQSRMIDDKNTPPNKDHIGNDIKLFTDRCIMCSRCVRFTREISGTAELQVLNRGDHSEIDIFPGDPCNNKLAGNVVDICPVGALCSKDFLYKQRLWFMRSQKSVCADCSTGCSIHVDQNKDVVYRLRPRYNPLAQGHFMCDEGRHGYHYINSRERFTRPMIRRGGQLEELPWPDALKFVRQELTEAASQNGSAVAGVLSPFLTCEEAYLLCKFLKGLSKDVRLALGPVPVVGEDDTYPKDRQASGAYDKVSGPEAHQPVKFTIRAEKCPNRRGVEEVLRHFQGQIIGFDEISRLAGDGHLQAVYLAAGYPPRPSPQPLSPAAGERGWGEGRWITGHHAAALQRVPLLVAHDLLPSPVSEMARYVFPAATFAEKDGTFVNHADLAQAIHWAVSPPGKCRTDGQVFLDLLERQGLVYAPTLRKELAEAIPYFAPMAGGDLGEYGIRLV